MPVHHIVFFKFKEEACTDQATSKIHSEIPATLLVIPGVTNAYFGRTFNETRAHDFTHALTVKFDDRESFENWASHPLHIKWGSTNVTPNLDGTPAECIRKLDIDVEGPLPKTAQHLVFFELDESFTEAHAGAVVEDLETTLALIPGVVDVAFVKAFIKGADPDMPFNYALTVKFESRAALEGYGNHPLHVKFGATHLAGHIKQVQCLDIETTEHAKVARL